MCACGSRADSDPWMMASQLSPRRHLILQSLPDGLHDACLISNDTAIIEPLDRVC